MGWGQLHGQRPSFRWTRLPPANVLLGGGFLAKGGVHGCGDIRMDSDLIPTLDFDDYVECRGGLSLQNRLLGAPASGFIIAQGNGLDAADEV